MNNTDDRTIVISRVLNAPRELVFEAFTDPKHLIKWWGPMGFTNTFQETDIRVGGKWKFIMHGPDGTDYPNLVIYDEIKKPERISYSHGEKEGEPMHFQVVITFEDQGEKTLLTMNSTFPSAEERDMVIREYGAIEGGNQTIDRLEEILLEMQES
jgi:uncharacterized protein YndB with AHSA1/START domain